MNKDQLERIVRAAGLAPELREKTLYDNELFVADGFSLPPHTAFRRFGIEKDDFKHGCYVTLWWISKGSEKLDIGRPIFFDVMHDIESLPIAARKTARINTARRDAEAFIKRRRRNMN